MNYKNIEETLEKLHNEKLRAILRAYAGKTDGSKSVLLGRCRAVLEKYNWREVGTLILKLYKTQQEQTHPVESTFEKTDTVKSKMKKTSSSDEAAGNCDTMKFGCDEKAKLQIGFENKRHGEISHVTPQKVLELPVCFKPFDASYELPFQYFWPMPFHKIIGTVIEPTEMISNFIFKPDDHHQEPFQGAKIKIELTNFTKEMIKSSEIDTSTGRCFRAGLLMRFSETQFRRDNRDSVPDKFCLTVNGLPLSVLRLDTSEDTPKKIYSKPMFITHLLNLEPNSENEIQVKWPLFEATNCLTRSYTFGCFCYERKKVCDLMAILKSGPPIPENRTLHGIKQVLLARDQSLLRIDLKCFIGKELMVLPVRGRTCLHLTAYDFGNFIGMQMEAGGLEVVCPVCDARLKLEEVSICTFTSKCLTFARAFGQDYVFVSADAKIYKDDLGK